MVPNIFVLFFFHNRFRFLVYQAELTNSAKNSLFTHSSRVLQTDGHRLRKSIAERLLYYTQCLQHENVNFGGQEVEVQGNTRPKIDFEGFQRFRITLYRFMSSNFSSFIFKMII